MKKEIKHLSNKIINITNTMKTTNTIHEDNKDFPTQEDLFLQNCNVSKILNLKEIFFFEGIRFAIGILGFKRAKKSLGDDKMMDLEMIHKIKANSIKKAKTEENDQIEDSSQKPEVERKFSKFEEIDITPERPYHNINNENTTERKRKRTSGFEIFNPCNLNKPEPKEYPKLQSSIDLRPYSESAIDDGSFIVLKVEKATYYLCKLYAYGVITKLKIPPSPDLSIGTHITLLCNKETASLISKYNFDDDRVDVKIIVKVPKIILSKDGVKHKRIVIIGKTAALA